MRQVTKPHLDSLLVVSDYYVLKSDTGPSQFSKMPAICESGLS